MCQKENPAPLAGGDRADIGFAEQQSSIRRLTENQARPFTLWDFQSRVIANVADEIAGGKRRILVVAPTGSGKTVMAVAIISRAVDRGERVLFLDHRRELTKQACQKLFGVGGIDAGVVQAGFPARPAEQVQVASVQTLYGRAIRGGAIEAPRADLVIIDEAHHVRARTYRKILDIYPDAVVIGLTATPCRADGRGLGNVFEVLVEAPQVGELVKLKHLVPTRFYAPARPDLTGVKVRHGDYVESQLAPRVDTPKLVGDVVEHWYRLAENRPTVVFATGVAHSVHLRDEFRRAGVMAEHIDGSTPVEERDRILGQLIAGHVEVVCNAMVLTEGWDAPEVSCLVLARPTKSLGLYRQMVGRVLRASPGKTDALVLDHAGAVFVHGLPEEPVLWTLDEDRKAENEVQTARQKHHAPGLVECPECSAIRLEGKPCEVCGWTPRPKAKPVEFEDGNLARVEHGRTVAGEDPYAPAAFHGQLVHYARHHNPPYKDGWAAHKFKEKFGYWPPRTAAPIPPTPPVLAWIRSRLIAYAREREKAGAP